MTFAYMSTDAPAAFPSSTPLAPTVRLNTSKTKFKLLRAPSMSELRAGIEEYALTRGKVLWREMSAIEGSSCKLFARRGNTLAHAAMDAVRTALGPELTTRAVRQQLAEHEMRDAIARVHPKGIAAMESLYRLNLGTECAIGYSQLMSVAESAASPYHFYDTLISTLFSNSAQSNVRGGSLRKSFLQPRVYEFLGFSVAKGWLLFPFVHSQSGIEEHAHLQHRDNAANSFHEAYRPPEAELLLREVAAMKVAKTTDVHREREIRHLMLASSFRSLEQATTPLFQTCVDLVLESDEKMTAQSASKLRTTLNALLRLHNARCPSAPAQSVLFAQRRATTLDEFASFAELREKNPDMRVWSEWFESFVKSTTDTQGGTRRTACTDFGDFLCTLSSPPLSPLNVTRAIINDYSAGNRACYRGYLAATHASPDARNNRLNQVAQFFEFVKQRLLASHRGDPKDAPWFAQPVDMKLDRFNEPPRSGTTRKAIGAHIMEEMRLVLTEDDYAWPRTQSSPSHLVDEKTRLMEYVWCPSAAITLYTLLSLPLRSVQARLMDSGEGDATIFDFDRLVMVPNPNQLPIDGVIDRGRQEGVLQVMPSGMLDVVDIVGIWVPVNKTSDTGYPVPWVSDDLLRHLRYQHEWVRRYAANPNVHGITDAQGTRNVPVEWSQNKKKFFCLFRDPSVGGQLDPSLPVSKQKLQKLWTELCAETERRINSRANSDSQRVKLVEVIDGGKVRALYDIHTLRVSGITDLLDRGVPLNIVQEYVAGHLTYMMTLWYDAPSPGQIRHALKMAEANAGRSHAAIPKFTDIEVEEMRPFLVTNAAYEGMYTGFDAVRDNAGLLQFRMAGICPGTRCEEGGLTPNGRIAPVPVGDRGPSCPQCRFWLTGPAFLLGQCIEGNQLIAKIHKKVRSLDTLRGSILEADDSQDFGRADLLRGQADVEERQLNDMLTEWWHRMKLYEASVTKLNDYQAFLASKSAGEPSQLMLVADEPNDELSFSFKRATALELDHFLSTCAELLPDYALESGAVARDLEMAVGKFLAINSHAELTNLYFTLDDAQRLTAANLAVEMMLGAAEDPSKAADILEGRTPLAALPSLQKGLAEMLLASSEANRQVLKKTIPIRVLK